MTAETDRNWGRVLLCGGTHWPKLGKKDAKNDPGNEEDHPDLPEPYLLRSLLALKMRAIHTSSHAVHFICITVDGDALLFGRNQSGCLGLPTTGKNGVTFVSENAPLRLRVKDLGGVAEATFVHAAAGRSHTLLVDSEGTVWAAGANNLGQCGIGSESPQAGAFKQVQGLVYEGEREKAIHAGVGLNFSAVVCASGRVYTFGSAEFGQTAQGATGERIATGNKTLFDVEDRAILVKTLLGTRITSLSCGNNHVIALSAEGLLYVWGYNGYCRLGLGNQVDVLKPRLVEQFVASKEGPDAPEGTARFVIAGQSQSIVIDKQGMLYMAGKWKSTGEGSSGSPYTTFRFLPDIMACKVAWASMGGVTHWMSTPSDSDLDPLAHPGPRMIVSWGQNPVNSELGLGPDEPKSCTKPSRHTPLDGLDVLGIAAGAHTTAFLVRPPLTNAKPNAKPPTKEGAEEEDDKYTNLPRWVEEVKDTTDFCVGCGKDDGDPLQCDKCDTHYHLTCLKPPLKSIPPGEWFCPKCTENPYAPIKGYRAPVYNSSWNGEEEDTGKKRKFGAGGGEGAKKRRA